MFDDYSAQYCEDDQDMVSSNIFNNEIPWSLHYFPSSDNIIPLEDFFPSYLIDPFNNNNARVDMISEEDLNSVDNKVKGSSMEKQQLTRKRLVSSSSKKKKDRHSKIDTARGLRDRRMRLSREVARQFFDLQDMLGVDKASKAIEWLLAQSSSAIKALSNSASTTTGIKHGSTLLEDKKLQEQTRKDPSAVRESREKARTRAKQRTREKMLVKTLKGSDHGEPAKQLQD